MYCYNKTFTEIYNKTWFWISKTADCVAILEAFHLRREFNRNWTKLLEHFKEIQRSTQTTVTWKLSFRQKRRDLEKLNSKSRRGEFSIQILQGKLRSKRLVYKRISMRGKISTLERLRSRFTVQIIDARTKKIQKTKSNLYYLAFQSLTSILCQTKFSIKFFHSVTLFLILKQNENVQHCNRQEAIQTPTTTLRDVNGFVFTYASSTSCKALTIDGCYTKIKTYIIFKFDNVQT